MGGGLLRCVMNAADLPLCDVFQSWRRLPASSAAPSWSTG